VNRQFTRFVTRSRQGVVLTATEDEDGRKPSTTVRARFHRGRRDRRRPERRPAARPRRRGSGHPRPAGRVGRGVRRRRHVHALRRPARGWGARRSADPMPVASRLFRRAHGRGGRGAGAQSALVLHGRAPRIARRGRREASAERGTPATGALSGERRHRRRGSRGHRGGRDAPPRGVRESGHDDRRRARQAGRSAEPLQGLPRRHRARGMGLPAGRELLRLGEGGARPRRPRGGPRARRAPRPAFRRDHAELRRAAPGHRGGRRPAADPGRRRSASSPCDLLPTAAP